MKKIAKIMALMALLCCVLAFVFAFTGNPLSWVLVRHRASQYLDIQYPELDIEIESIIYDHLFGGFDVDVTSPTSRDTHFTLTLDGWGNVKYDRYDAVTSGANTVARLSREYQNLVNNALTGSVFADARVYAEFCTPGTIEYNTFTHNHSTRTRTIEKDFSIDLSALELDQDYDLAVLGAAHGELDIHITVEDATIEKAAALLLALKAELDAHGVAFHAVEFYLSPAGGGQDIILWDFLSADIGGEGLVERVEQAHLEYLAYWAGEE
ncbi:MAG: hypothetical protein IJ960_03885 [Oscillospiraceae bacterium]|nr:hypothetical protein [Oscillospiraceae bacterium]